MELFSKFCNSSFHLFPKDFFIFLPAAAKEALSISLILGEHAIRAAFASSAVVATSKGIKSQCFFPSIPFLAGLIASKKQNNA